MTVKTRTAARTATNKGAAPRIAKATAAKGAPRVATATASKSGPRIATATASKGSAPKIAIATATASKKSAPAAQKATKPAKPLAWKKFQKLGGRALSPEVIVAQLVGETVFPGFVLGKAADAQPSDFFEVGHEDDREVPTNHELSVSDGNVEYRVRFLMVRDDSYKEAALAVFGALREALKALLGKRTRGDARTCVWTLADREIDLHVSSSPHDRPEAEVTLMLRAL